MRLYTDIFIIKSIQYKFLKDISALSKNYSISMKFKQSNPIIPKKVSKYYFKAITKYLFRSSDDW